LEGPGAMQFDSHHARVTNVTSSLVIEASIFLMALGSIMDGAVRLETSTVAALPGYGAASSPRLTSRASVVQSQPSAPLA